MEADLHDRYGIDFRDINLMRSRTWRWLRVRITGLLDIPPQVTYLGHGQPPLVMPATRLGFVLSPPRRE